MRVLNMFILVTLLTFACASHTITKRDVTGPQQWGGSANVTHLKHLYFSEQPDAEALQIAKTNGVTTVISLREPTESDWDERAAAEKLGMTFINIPLAKSSTSFDPNAIARIEMAIKAREGEQVLLHCSSGNRATAWLAIHLNEKHQLSEANSLAIARKAGLSKSSMEQRVRTYLDDNN